MFRPLLTGLIVLSSLAAADLPQAKAQYYGWGWGPSIGVRAYGYGYGPGVYYGPRAYYGPRVYGPGVYVGPSVRYGWDGRSAWWSVGPSVELQEGTRRSTAASVPTPEQLAELTKADLNRGMQQTVVQFDAELGRFNTAETWRRYFKLDEVQRALEDLDDRPPSGESAAALDKVLQAMDSVAGVAEYHQITSLAGFRTLRLALREYLASPAEGVEPESLPAPATTPPQLPAPAGELPLTPPQ